MWYDTNVSEDYTASMLQLGPPKHWYPTSLHGVTTQKTVTSIITVKTPSLASFKLYYPQPTIFTILYENKFVYSIRLPDSLSEKHGHTLIK
jgi:hypothetical protein